MTTDRKGRCRPRFTTKQHKGLVEAIADEKKKLLDPTADQQAVAKRIKELEGQLEQKAVASKPPAVPVMQELPEGRQRKTRLLVKGDFLNPGVEVKAGVLTSLHSAPSGDSRKNRLALAHWLMSKENPLTARVAVNRIWSRIFGSGLVETEEDLELRDSSQSSGICWIGSPSSFVIRMVGRKRSCARRSSCRPPIGRRPA